MKIFLKYVCVCASFLAAATHYQPIFKRAQQIKMLNVTKYCNQG